MYNDKLVYKVVIWVFWEISLWKEKEALIIWLTNDYAYVVQPLPIPSQLRINKKYLIMSG